MGQCIKRAPGPDFLIVGAMKSATSTLHEQLALQSGFFMSRPKEPNFFSDDEVYARGLGWYQDLFASAPVTALRGESSTHYTKLPDHPRTVERLTAAFGTGLKIIYLMRHPIDRLISHYIHDWTERIISDPIDDAVVKHPNLVDYGRYAMQLEPWLRAFGPAQVLPVFFDRLRIHSQAELDRVGAFLGAEQPLRWSEANAQRNLSSERIRVPVWLYNILTSPAVRGASRRLFTKQMRSRLTARWRMAERPDLSPASRDALEERFDQDLARLGGWLGIPLNCRSFKAETTGIVPAWTADAPRSA